MFRFYKNTGLSRLAEIASRKVGDFDVLNATNHRFCRNNCANLNSPPDYCKIEPLRARNAGFLRARNIMSKMKTKKAAVKRIKVTGSGKLRRRKVGLAHLQTKRSTSSQMRNNDGAVQVADCNKKVMKRLLGI